MPTLINTIIAVFLAFFIIVGGSFVFLGHKSDLRADRVTYNEMANLMDKVKDTGQLTDADKSDFYLALATTGVIYEVTMTRKLKVVNPAQGSTGKIQTTYITLEDNSVYNQGDLFELKVRAVNYTGIQKVTAALLSIVYPKFDESQTGVVENG